MKMFRLRDQFDYICGTGRRSVRIVTLSASMDRSIFLGDSSPGALPYHYTNLCFLARSSCHRVLSTRPFLQLQSSSGRTSITSAEASQPRSGISQASASLPDIPHAPPCESVPHLFTTPFPFPFPPPSLLLSQTCK